MNNMSFQCSLRMVLGFSQRDLVRILSEVMHAAYHSVHNLPTQHIHVYFKFSQCHVHKTVINSYQKQQYD